MYKEVLRQAWVEINLSNLDYNIKQIKKRVGSNCELIGVVKADAYGHGSVETVKILKENNVNKFAVATIQEAVTLRETGIDDAIFSLGIIPNLYAAAIIKYNISPVICSYDNAKAISEKAVENNTNVNVLLAVDTGMGRIGFMYTYSEAVKEEISMIMDLPNINVVGLFSHFSTADEANHEFLDKQLNRYNDFYEKLSLDGISLIWRSLANSAAIIETSRSHFEAARPGIILYGCYPSSYVNKNNLSLKPVMSVKANIVYLKTVPKGFSVSYGRKFIADKPTKIATIAIGYADGYSRTLSGKAKVLVRGQKVPVVGNICMDQCMIDVTNVHDVALGDEVTIMGNDGDLSVTAEDLAEAAGTINYEILCGFGMRLPKYYTTDEK